MRATTPSCAYRRATQSCTVFKVLGALKTDFTIVFTPILTLFANLLAKFQSGDAFGSFLGVFLFSMRGLLCGRRASRSGATTSGRMASGSGANTSGRMAIGSNATISGRTAIGSNTIISGRMASCSGATTSGRRVSRSGATTSGRMATSSAATRSAIFCPGANLPCGCPWCITVPEGEGRGQKSKPNFLPSHLVTSTRLLLACSLSWPTMYSESSVFKFGCQF